MLSLTLLHWTPPPSCSAPHLNPWKGLCYFSRLIPQDSLSSLAPQDVWRRIYGAMRATHGWGWGNGEMTPRHLPLLLANRLPGRGQVMLRALWLLWLKELLSGRSRWHWGVKEGVRIGSGNSCSEWKEYWAENYLKWEAVKSLRL